MKESRSCGEKRVGDEGCMNWRWIVEETLCRGMEELIIMKTNRMIIIMIHRHVPAGGVSCVMYFIEKCVSIGRSTDAAIRDRKFAQSYILPID